MVMEQKVVQELSIGLPDIVGGELLIFCFIRLYIGRFQALITRWHISLLLFASFTIGITVRRLHPNLKKVI